MLIPPYKLGVKLSQLLGESLQLTILLMCRGVAAVTGLTPTAVRHGRVAPLLKDMQHVSKPDTLGAQLIH
jgi:hypothetical protein